MEHDFSEVLKTPYGSRKDFCINCHSHFMSGRPHIKSVVITKHFYKDLKDFGEVQSVVRDVLDCSGADFYELHKFEEHIDGNMIFRAKKEGLQMIYCVDREMRIIFCALSRILKNMKGFWETKRKFVA